MKSNRESFKQMSISETWTCRSRFEWYTFIFLPVVFQEIWKTNHQRRITLRYDNVCSQTTAKLLFCTPFSSSIKLFEASSQPMKYLVHKLLQTKFRIFPHQSITCPFFRINSANFNVYYCIYITPNINSWIS